MATAKNLGIWMDHSSAHLMEFVTHPIATKSIKSKFTYRIKEYSLSKRESLVDNNEQNQPYEYYKTIVKVIRNYEDIILFGPTNSKVELYNILSADYRFANSRINIEQTGKMTEDQQHAFLIEHFSRH